MKPLSAPSLCLALCMALGLAGAVPSGAAIAPSTFLQLGTSVLRVEVLQARGGYGIGSGVVVAPDKVVTNCHVTRDAREVHVQRGAQRWRADAQASDIEHDLCVLRVPGMAVTPAQLGRAGSLAIGQAVVALGFSGGMGIQSSDGTIVALHKLDGSQVAQSSNRFSSGASGGGLFDDKLRLVGILTFRLRGGEAHYFAAPVEWLHPLLADESAYRAVAPTDGASLSYWEQPPQEQPNFLKAVVLEREARWDELESLAFNWTRVDADDAEPWYLHGLALDALQRLPESQRALERALSLEPSWREAWFRLGLVYLNLGLRDRALQAQARLEILQSDFARDLLHAIESR